MKKFIFVALITVICVTCTLIASSSANAETDSTPEMEVIVKEDNYIEIKINHFHGGKVLGDDSLNIYKADDDVVTGSFEPRPIIYYYTYDEGTTFYYPEPNPIKAEWIHYNDRMSELTNGENSTLKPGKYFAVIIGYYEGIVNYEFSDRYYFEIPDLETHKETPAPSPTETPTPAPTPTPNPTGDCLSFSSPTPTTIPTITPNPTGSCLLFSSPELSEDSNSGISAVRIVIYVSLFAFILITGIIITVVIKKKNK